MTEENPRFMTLCFTTRPIERSRSATSILAAQSPEWLAGPKEQKVRPIVPRPQPTLAKSLSTETLKGIREPEVEDEYDHLMTLHFPTRPMQRSGDIFGAGSSEQLAGPEKHKTRPIVPPRPVLAKRLSSETPGRTLVKEPEMDDDGIGADGYVDVGPLTRSISRPVRAGEPQVMSRRTREKSAVVSSGLQFFTEGGDKPKSKSHSHQLQIHNQDSDLSITIIDIRQENNSEPRNLKLPRSMMKTHYKAPALPQPHHKPPTRPPNSPSRYLRSASPRDAPKRPPPPQKKMSQNEVSCEYDYVDIHTPRYVVRRERKQSRPAQDLECTDFGVQSTHKSGRYMHKL